MTGLYFRAKADVPAIDDGPPTLPNFIKEKSMTPRDRIANLLAHYFRLAFERAGLGWDSDNESEMQQLADAIEAAVNDAVRAHAEDAPHIYPDGSTR